MTGSIDSRLISDNDIAGLSWRVSLDDDEWLTAPEGDCYTPTQVAAFGRDWQYVIVTVTPVIAGCDLDGLTETLGAVEYGTYTLTDDDDNVTGTREIDLDYLIDGMPDDDGGYPVPDMIREAKAQLAKMSPVFAAVFGQVSGGFAQAA